MVQVTHGDVQHGSVDPPGGRGRVWGHSRRSSTGLETLGDVRVGSEEPVGRSGKGWGTHPMVRDESGDPWAGPGRVGKPSKRSGTGRETLPEVRDGSEDH